MICLRWQPQGVPKLRLKPGSVRCQVMFRTSVVKLAMLGATLKQMGPFNVILRVSEGTVASDNR